MLRTINFLILLLITVIAGNLTAEAFDLPALLGVAAFVVPSFFVPQAGVLLMGANLFSVKRPAGSSPASGGGINTEIIMFLQDDVQTHPVRGEDKITVTQAIAMKIGKYMHVLYATDKTIKPIQTKVESDNPDINVYEVGIEFFHPGLEKPILQFLAEHGYQNFYLILRNCSNNMMYLLGEPCNSQHLTKSELEWGIKPSEGKGNNMAFMGEQSLPYAIYEGDLVLEPADVSGSPSGA